MSVMDPPADPETILQERFGLERFRKGQREVIEEVLKGNDVLCVMPTGGGKSLCYQLPALSLTGVTLVVSPLIALMKDQVDALTARGLRATLINSTLEPAEQNARMAEIEMGRYDLVYVAPERFRSGRFVEMMGRIKLTLLAVDEAHCISEWGHDFRPDYARLGAARKTLGMPPCIALTATATDLVRRDIADQLDLREPKQFVTGFDRPNLTYHARPTRKDAEKLQALAEVLERNPGPAIVYASSRKRCEEIGSYLGKSLRREAVTYHAGMDRDMRETAQDRFMNGHADVVVATNAFGMGVDKADIRSVIHFNMPGTLEAYYQEAGRAGRDGRPAECVLIYAPGDRYLQEMFIENEYPPADAVHRIYDFLRTIDADPIELTLAEIREKTPIDLNVSAVGTALRILESSGALERFRPRENMAIIRINDEAPISDRVGANAHVQRLVAIGLEGLVNRRYGEPVYFQPDDLAQAMGLDRAALTRAIKNLAADFAVDYVPPFRGNAVRVIDRKRRSRDLGIDFTSLNKRKGQEYDKLERMIKYAESRTCRRAFILGYFGDAEIRACGKCDNCGPSGGGVDAVSAPIDTIAGREVVQKVLSGVARSKGNFGKIAVADMLIGSSSEKMEKTGLKRLSTFGVMARSGFTRREVVDLIDALTAAGLIATEDVDRFRPVVKLSETGWAWIRDPEATVPEIPLDPSLADKVRNGGLEKLSSAATSHREVASESASILDTAGGPAVDSRSNDPLHETLRHLRLNLAREAGLSPAYVFSNETLDDLVRQRPRTPQALAQIKGIGPAKLERFGSALIAAISGGSSEAEARPIPIAPETVASRPSTPPPPTRREGPRREPVAVDPGPPPPTSSSYVSTEEWTWRLLDRGFTLDEAAAIRGLEISALVRHATWSARKGRGVPPVAFLSPETVDRWTAHLRDRGVDAPAPDGELGERYWELFVACQKAPDDGKRSPGKGADEVGSIDAGD